MNHIYIILCTHIYHTVYVNHCLVLMVGLVSSPTQNISTIVRKRTSKIVKRKQKNVCAGMVFDHSTILIKIKSLKTKLGLTPYMLILWQDISIATCGS